MNNGGPAFPCKRVVKVLYDGSAVREDHEGLSLRDYFAAKAIAFVMQFDRIDGEPQTFESHAEAAYMLADAMLKARDTGHSERGGEKC